MNCFLVFHVYKLEGKGEGPSGGGGGVVYVNTRRVKIDVIAGEVKKLNII